MTWKISNTPIDPDPYYGAVSLLLHGDGTDGSTNIIDSSLSPKTVTAFGNAQISTAQSKFGGSSLAFDGNGDFLTIPYSSDLVFGSNNFTIEAWIYPVTLSGSQFLTTQHNYGGLASHYFLLNNNTLTAVFYVNNAGYIATVNGVQGNQWNHVSIGRNGNAGIVSLNGTISTVSISGSLDNPVQPLNIGRQTNSTYFFNGYIDDLRITNGVARYTSNFTPPTAPFPNF